MEEFPNDVLRTIFPFIEKKDWLHVLLTCKRFLHVGLDTFAELEGQTSHEESYRYEQEVAQFLETVLPANRVYCKGSCEVEDHFAILDLDGHPLDLSFSNPNDVKKLIENCSKAPFGRGSETIFDENIRNGLQLTASRVARDPAYQEYLEDVIIDQLVPHATYIRAELYKIVVYREGEYFKSHKDTIRAPDHFGTLVIFAPTSYEGGELMIRHLGKEVMIAEANFVAFFTDIEHEVLPVSKGVRIAFTYNLYTEQKPWPRSITDKLLVAKFSKLLRPFTRYERFSCVGIALEHDYSLKSLSPEYLKGNDKILYDLLRNFARKLIPIEIVEGKQEESGPRVEMDVYCIDPDQAYDLSDEDEMSSRRSYRKKTSKVIWLELKRGNYEEISQASRDTGNEGTIDIFQYIQAGLLIALKETPNPFQFLEEENSESDEE